jgi:hypothetical protein
MVESGYDEWKCLAAQDCAYDEGACYVSSHSLISIGATYKASKTHGVSSEQPYVLVSLNQINMMTLARTGQVFSYLSLGVPVIHLSCSNVASRPETPNVKPANREHKISKTAARIAIPIQAPS